jgi:DNA-binding transcriptional ArsR family regulator
VPTPAAAALALDALNDRNRRRILEFLRDDERAVGEVVRKLRISQPLASKHLKVLRQAGLVDVRVDAQRRLYRVRLEPLQELDAWLAPYRALWSSHLDDLERHLDSMPDE